MHDQSVFMCPGASYIKLCRILARSVNKKRENWANSIFPDCDIVIMFTVTKGKMLSTEYYSE